MNVVEAKGDLFNPDFRFDAIGHGVNCFGQMGAGIAVTFRENYPAMYRRYKAMCDGKFLLPGMAMPWLELRDSPNKSLWIYNIASQFRPGPDAKLSFLEAGLEYTRFHMEERGNRHLGLPWIGAGIGGLDINEVMEVVGDVFDDSSVKVTVVEYKEK